MLLMYLQSPVNAKITLAYAKKFAVIQILMLKTPDML